VKSLVWDDDKGHFVEDDPIVTMTVSDDDGKVIAEGHGDTVKQAMDALSEALEVARPEQRKVFLEGVLGALILMMEQKLANNDTWGSFNREWRNNYLVALREGSEAHRRNAAFIK
jgi:hypothetical protein